MSGQANPIGTTVSSHIEESRDDPEFRAEYDRLRPFEEFARIVIRRRAELGLSQGELAARMGVPDSTISQAESGQGCIDFGTLKRFADVFGVRAVLGFEFGAPETPERELLIL